MKWKEVAEGKSVKPYDVVMQAVINARMANDDVTGAQITKDNLSVMQRLYGAEVTERGLQDQVREASKEVEGFAHVNPVALATLHYGVDFDAEDVNLVTWAVQNGKQCYLGQRVASRIYGRNMMPYDRLNVGSLVFGKKAGAIFGFTRVESVTFLTITAETEEDYVTQVAEARAKLTEMAAAIPDEDKLLVTDTSQSNDYWAGVADFAETARKKQGSETRVAYVTLVTFEDWVMLNDAYAGNIPGKGMAKIDLSIGKGPGASWYVGLSNNVTAPLATFEAKWFVPQKRGRKPKAVAAEEVTEEAEVYVAEVPEPAEVPEQVEA